MCGSVPTVIILICAYRKLQHPRVARLFGVVSRNPYFAVFELPVNGDLKSFLVSIKNSRSLLLLFLTGSQYLS